MDKVKVGTWSFSSPKWENISKDAKDFVTKMLTYDPHDRPNA